MSDESRWIGDRNEPMPGWLPKAVVLVAAAVAGFIVTVWLVERLRSLLIMILVSLFLSFALEPAVNWLQRRGMRRGVATLGVFVVVLAAIAGFLFAVGTVLSDQVVRLVDDAPGYIEDTQAWLGRRGIEVNVDELLAEFQAGGAAASFAQDLAANIIDVGTAVLGVLFQLLTIGLFTFYLTADGPRFRRTICSVLSPRRQTEVLHVWDVAISKTGGYIYSRALLAALSFVFHWVVFSIIGLPSPLPLALWVAVISQFVPVIGTYIAGVVPGLIAVLDDPVSAIWVIGAIVIYQQVENYVFAPRVTAQTMEMHPAVAFGAVIAGTGVLGIVGALLALPAAATIQAFVSGYVERHELVESGLLWNDGTTRSSLTPDRTGELPIIDVSKPAPGRAPDPGTDGAS